MRHNIEDIKIELIVIDRERIFIKYKINNVLLYLKNYLWSK